MFVTTATPPAADGTSPATRQLPPSIEATSPFTPKHWLCPSCDAQNPMAAAHCARARCSHERSGACALLDQRDRPLARGPFPASWLCSTCGAPHHAVSILAGDPACACGRPALQAVYDQFGRLFLFWRDDGLVRDLTDACAVGEAARRLWASGGAVWVDEMVPVARMRAAQQQQQQEEGEEEEVEVRGAGREMEMLSGPASVLVDVVA